ncbi:hypothetical protein METBIDRAFT_153541 [Metschnikowia bicuspidata var. bicuspidata NRRL YB-4993]|uniref:Uncharacterized protein n=1 Tax=Metschnikowia bicuspidata var. bicuspidata NRRL YB-4993 TaxID=869754 RepID=A0A1A0HEP0_9ASCO|nr:hypothetical protein METBIDRAFT_153541 [Metschnikowia bicuspidata var. bicuspidata NRRL YB-4993]OBA22440.1 hypothetical protein METBIDRAFT_153541 [Metschnikowia bicuspidata var. bicuspidata NRRL YB-4993]
MKIFTIATLAFATLATASPVDREDWRRKARKGPSKVFHSSNAAPDALPIPRISSDSNAPKKRDIAYSSWPKFQNTSSNQSTSDQSISTGNMISLGVEESNESRGGSVSSHSISSPEPSSPPTSAVPDAAISGIIDEYQDEFGGDVYQQGAQSIDPEYAENSIDPRNEPSVSVLDSALESASLPDEERADLPE